MAGNVLKKALDLADCLKMNLLQLITKAKGARYKCPCLVVGPIQSLLFRELRASWMLWGSVRDTFFLVSDL